MSLQPHFKGFKWMPNHCYTDSWTKTTTNEEYFWTLLPKYIYTNFLPFSVGTCCHLKICENNAKVITFLWFNKLIVNHAGTQKMAARNRNECILGVFHLEHKYYFIEQVTFLFSLLLQYPNKLTRWHNHSKLR